MSSGLSARYRRVRTIWRRRAVTTGYAAAGAAIAAVLDFPVPLLLGSLFACLVAALLQVRMESYGIVSDLFRTYLAVTVGASVTPAVILGLPALAPSLALMAVYTCLIAAVGYPLLRCVFRYDRATAYFSAMPGGLQEMLTFGEAAGGNMRTLSLIHATRVMLIVSAAPFFLDLFWGLDLTRPPAVAGPPIDPWETVIMLLAGPVGWWVAERIRLFGASIIGPLLLTAGLSLSGVITGRPPAEMIWAMQFVIGLSVGVKYAGVTLRELRTDVAAGAAYSVVLTVISGSAVLLVVSLGLAAPLEALLAFLPGGQGEMVIIGIIAGADLAFVISHHLLRYFLVTLTAPLAARHVRNPEP